MSKQELLHRGIGGTDWAYSLCEHVESALNGMVAITKHPQLSDPHKLHQIQRSLATSRYLLGDVMAYLGAEQTELKALLHQSQGGGHE